MPDDFEALTKRQVAAYLERANKTALENMIALCLHAMSPEALADFLRSQADFIEQDMV